jgi:hypothetical protein
MMRPRHVRLACLPVNAGRAPSFHSRQHNCRAAQSRRFLSTGIKSALLGRRQRGRRTYVDLAGAFV